MFGNICLQGTKRNRTIPDYVSLSIVLHGHIEKVRKIIICDSLPAPFLASSKPPSYKRLRIPLWINWGLKDFCKMAVTGKI